MKKTLLIAGGILLSSLSALAQNVNIPDTTFKAALVGNSSINTNNDGEIQVSEATAFSGQISLQSGYITDLTGIEAFVNLTTLQCVGANLDSISFSQNTALTMINLRSCHLNAIDVSQNTILKYFLLENNDLTSVDVSTNTALISFMFSNNDISKIDVSQNTNLNYFNCDNNNLKYLDVSNSPNLVSFNCSQNELTSLNMKNVSTTSLTTFDATSNSGLTCIQVDDATAATTAWTNIDATASFSENCNYLISTIVVQGQSGISSISISGGTLQMEALITPGYAANQTYTWSVTNNSGSASIDTNGLVTALSNGTVTITATANDGSGASGDAIITISNQSTAGISDDEKLISVSIYPNPVNFQLVIDTEEEIKSVSIVDAMGKTIKTVLAQNKTLDVSDLKKGIYFLQVQTSNGIASKRFIKD